jgi:hypothetical protein
MWRRRTLAWLVAYLTFSTLLVFVVWPHRANFPPISADEVWIMSASFKLATQGILGSDLFAGYYGADRHYFLNLPVHHFIQATFFRVFGPGVAQARAPSVVAGVIVLCAIGWLAYKWVGLGCSVVTGILMLFWRSNFVAPDPRPPLVALAQSGRYDVMVLSLWWLVILVLYRHLERPGRATALACGLLAGVTALTQFYGGGVLLCCAAALLWAKRRGTPGPLYGREVVIGALLPIVIYAAYIGAHWADFIDQARIQASRVRVYDPRFSLANLLDEWRRFAWLLEPSRDLVGAWASFLAIPLAFLVAARLLRCNNFLAFVSVLGTFLSLALLDSIKARIYASLLVPIFCFGLGAALDPTLPAFRRAPYWAWLRRGAACALIGWIVLDGLGGYRFIANEGPRVSQYAAVGERIAASIEDPVPILGSQRWWWALRTRPYRSLNAQWEIWNMEQRAGHTPDFGLMIAKLGGAYLILDNDTRGDLTRVPPQLRQQVNEVLTARTALVGAWRDPTYGLIEIYRF